MYLKYFSSKMRLNILKLGVTGLSVVSFQHYRFYKYKYKVYLVYNVVTWNTFYPTTTETMFMNCRFIWIHDIKIFFVTDLDLFVMKKDKFQNMVRGKNISLSVLFRSFNFQRFHHYANRVTMRKSFFFFLMINLTWKFFS